MNLRELIKKCHDPNTQIIEIPPGEDEKAFVELINKENQLSIFGVKITYLSFLEENAMGYIVTREGPKNLGIQIANQDIPTYIALGLNPNLQDSTGRTLLNHAVKGRYFKQTKALLEAGADPRLKGSGMLNSPLEFVQNIKNPEHEGYEEIRKIVLQYAGERPEITKQSPPQFSAKLIKLICV